MNNQNFKEIALIKELSYNLKDKSFEDLLIIRDKYLQKFPFVTEIEWFALVQEISTRILGLRPFDAQLIAGLFLNKGQIVEMKTGEGKTLTATLALSYKALSRKGAHLITTNEYLAERDQNFTNILYNTLGINSKCIKSKNSLAEKRENYRADITYVSNSELIFDYLKDHLNVTTCPNILRPFFYAVVDEADSILIDNLQIPFVLSETVTFKNFKHLYDAKIIAEKLKKNRDFIISKEFRSIILTTQGYKNCKNILNRKNFNNEFEFLIAQILNALNALYLYKKDNEYILQNNKINIVDPLTGRLLNNSRWANGLHEAIEIKENVPVTNISKTKLTIIYPNFFSLYPLFSGMTGTIMSSRNEIKILYDKEVKTIKLSKPQISTTFPNLLFLTEKEKQKALIRFIIKIFKTKQPILIGTSSVSESEILSNLLIKKKIPHQILNAKFSNLLEEKFIISNAGKLGAITITTNMATRGTNIILGGNFEFIVQQKIKKLIVLLLTFDIKVSYLSFLEKDYPNELEQLFLKINNYLYFYPIFSKNFQNFFLKCFNGLFSKWKDEQKKVKKLGGLIVIGTKINENQRIDNQLLGRSGRSGDPGISQFYISIESQQFTFYKLLVFLKFFLKHEFIKNFFVTQIKKNREKYKNTNLYAKKKFIKFNKILEHPRKYFFFTKNLLSLNNNWFEEIYLLKELCTFNFVKRILFLTNLNFKSYLLFWHKVSFFNNEYCFKSFFQPYINFILSKQEILINVDAYNVRFRTFNTVLENSFMFQKINLLWDQHYGKMVSIYNLACSTQNLEKYIHPISYINLFKILKLLNINILRTIFFTFNRKNYSKEFSL